MKYRKEGRKKDVRKVKRNARNNKRTHQIAGTT